MPQRRRCQRWRRCRGRRTDGRGHGGGREGGPGDQSGAAGGGGESHGEPLSVVDVPVDDPCASRYRRGVFAPAYLRLSEVAPPRRVSAGGGWFLVRVAP